MTPVDAPADDQPTDDQPTELQPTDEQGRIGEFVAAGEVLASSPER